MFQSGASTPVGLFAFGASLIGSAGWFGLAWLEATELDELEGGR
ncbi:hypothetical protein [Halorubrum sp. CBA1229]|nr:hypothetical protein [Halorubrum sp. CBA1229]